MLAPVIGAVIRIFSELMSEVARIGISDESPDVPERLLGTDQKQYGGIPDSEQTAQCAILYVQMKTQIISNFALGYANGFGEMFDAVVRVTIFPVLHPSENTISDNDFNSHWQYMLQMRFTMK